MNDQPEAFGFHENAALAHAQTETTSLFRAILTMQDEDRDEVVEWGGVARCSEEAAELSAANILSSLPNDVSTFLFHSFLFCLPYFFS
jgi:hypothetical protein